MKSIGNKPTIRSINGFNSALALLVLVLCGVSSSAQAAERNTNPGIVPVAAKPYGKTLAEWSAVWWQVGIEHPLEGNPLFEGGAFELSSTVWGIAAPLGEGTFSTSVPAGKALFFPLVTIECSSLEPEESGFHGDTEAEQAECATFWADHIVDLSFEIDGVPVENVETYRVVSPQFSFVAPDPNIFGVPGGGAGTAVADGYYLMLPPLSKGVHTTRLQGTLHFSTAEGDPFDLELVTDNVFVITAE